MLNITISACLRRPSWHLSDAIITLVTGSGPGLPRLLLFLCWEFDGRRFLALLFTLQTRPKLVAFPAVVQKRVIKTHSAHAAAELKEPPTNSERLHESADTGFSELVARMRHQQPPPTGRCNMTAPPTGGSDNESVDEESCW